MSTGQNPAIDLERFAVSAVVFALALVKRVGFDSSIGICCCKALTISRGQYWARAVRRYALDATFPPL